MHLNALKMAFLQNLFPQNRAALLSPSYIPIGIRLRSSRHVLVTFLMVDLQEAVHLDRSSQSGVNRTGPWSGEYILCFQQKRRNAQHPYHKHQPQLHHGSSILPRIYRHRPLARSLPSRRRHTNIRVCHQQDPQVDSRQVRR